MTSQNKKSAKSDPKPKRKQQPKPQVTWQIHIPGTRMEAVAFIFGAIATALGITMAALSLRGHHHYTVLWLGCVAIMCVAAGGTSWLHNYWRKIDAASAKTASDAASAILTKPAEPLPADLAPAAKRQRKPTVNRPRLTTEQPVITPGPNTTLDRCVVTITNSGKTDAIIKRIKVYALHHSVMDGLFFVLEKLDFMLEGVLNDVVLKPGDKRSLNVPGGPFDIYSKEEPSGILMIRVSATYRDSKGNEYSDPILFRYHVPMAQFTEIGEPVRPDPPPAN